MLGYVVLVKEYQALKEVPREEELFAVLPPGGETGQLSESSERERERRELL